jgi:hypothetical protein
MLSRVDLGHLAAQHALGAVAEPLSALLGDELLANLARLSVTIVVQVLLQAAERYSESLVGTRTPWLKRRMLSALIIT